MWQVENCVFQLLWKEYGYKYEKGRLSLLDIGRITSVFRRIFDTIFYEKENGNGQIRDL